MISCESYISINYDIIGSKTSEDLKKCNTYLLGEYHDCPAIIRANGLFISQFAKPTDTLLLEGVNSLEPHPFPSEAILDARITGVTIPDERILGWDVPTSDFAIVQWVVNTTIDICEEACESGDFYQLASIDWGEKFKPFYTAGGERSDPPSEAEKKFLLMGQEMAQWAEEKIRSTEDSAILSKVYEEKLAELQTRIDQWVVETFPLRVDSMIRTLEAIQQTIKSDEKVFLIAGMQHLEERKNESRYEAFCLKRFDAFLANHPTIVALKPKVSV